MSELQKLQEQLNVGKEEVFNYFLSMGIEITDDSQLTSLHTDSFTAFWKKKLQMLEQVNMDETNDDTLLKKLVSLGENHYNIGSYKEAFDYFLLASESGDLYALYMVGRCLENDLGIADTTSKAIEYYLRCAQADFGKAIYRLAQCYEQGLGVEQNYGEAAQYYKLALKHGYNTQQDYDHIASIVRAKFVQQAENGDAKGYFRLASYLVKRQGKSFDDPQVREYVTLAAQSGDSSALYRMGLYAEDENNETQAKAYFISAAKNGNTPALLHLQDKYDVNAMDLIVDNAEQLLHMGDYYLKRGDIDQALNYYMKSAEKNNPQAQCKIGMLYIKYPSYETDLQKNHIYWLKLACQGGDADAYYRLGICYEGGGDTIVEEDRAKAFEYFEKSANLGQVLAQSKLGFYYKRGIVVAKDYEKSYNWYLQASQAGHAIAQNQLAFCYLKGEGVELDKNEAFNWFKKAAEQNHYIALYQLGLCYMYGTGCEKDYALARECFEKALDNGYEAAQKQLGVLNRIDKLNGESNVDKLRSNFTVDNSKIDIDADLKKWEQNRQQKIQDVTTKEITNTATEYDINKFDIDSLNEKQCIELMFRLQEKINANVLDEVIAQNRLDMLNSEEKLQQAKDLLAQTGFTAEQMELLKNYFNKE